MDLKGRKKSKNVVDISREPTERQRSKGVIGPMLDVAMDSQKRGGASRWRGGNARLFRTGTPRNGAWLHALTPRRIPSTTGKATSRRTHDA